MGFFSLTGFLVGDLPISQIEMFIISDSVNTLCPTSAYGLTVVSLIV